MANWQRSGGRGRRPKPLSVPEQVERFGGSLTYTPEEMREILDRWSDA